MATKASFVTTILGHRFQCSYDLPSESAIEAEAESMHKQFKWRSIEDCKALAESKLSGKAYDDAISSIALNTKKIKEKIEDNKADIGFSQRQKEKLSFELGGVMVKEIDDENASSTVLSDDKVKANLTRLIDDLNTEIIKNVQAKGKAATSSLILDPNPTAPYLKNVHDIVMNVSGGGSPDALWAQEASRINRFGRSLLPVNREMVGYTFITRPCCNLSRSNLAGNRKFSPLIYAPDNSAATMIRWYLDTRHCDNMLGDHVCPLIDVNNPFFVILMNNLKSINGFSDPSLTIESSDGGFFSETQSTPVGMDRLARGGMLQLQFKDMPGAPVMAIHDYWMEYIGFLGEGSMNQYPEDIEDNLMAYTVSIYRLMVDRSTRVITRWAKATGCFPQTDPVGTPFNKSEGEHFSQAVSEFTVPYQYHKLEYNDPIILTEFNILVDRYRGKKITDPEAINLEPDIMNNYDGIPYIRFDNGVYELLWQRVNDTNGRFFVPPA